MFELLNRIRPLHLLQLPQTSETPESIDHWEQELRKVAALLEKKTGNTISDESLKSEIKLYNRLRSTTEALFRLNSGAVPLVYGLEIDNITGAGGFDLDIEQRIRDMEKAIEMIKHRAFSHHTVSAPPMSNQTEANLSLPDQTIADKYLSRNNHRQSSKENCQVNFVPVIRDHFLAQMAERPRILLTGCPTTHKKVLHLIENSGGVVVAMESCGGLKSVGDPVDETIDPIRALAEKYLKIPCACMTPNSKRQDLIGSLIDEYRVDGVVELIWDACHTYNVESFQIQEAVNQRFDRPYLKIKTDYSQNDMGQLETRIEAFLEILR